jgi:hypothetical protein
MSKSTVSRQIETRAHKMREKARGGERAVWPADGWLFTLSYGWLPGTSVRKPRSWSFTAILATRGRSSTVEDWAVLGRWAAAVGVPRSSFDEGTAAATDPSGVQSFVWGEEQAS